MGSCSLTSMTVTKLVCSAADFSFSICLFLISFANSAIHLLSAPFSWPWRGLTGDLNCDCCSSSSVCDGDLIFDLEDDCNKEEKNGEHFIFLF